ncbi:hypothetical protein, partial [Gordonia alkanivorans]
MELELARPISLGRRTPRPVLLPGFIRIRPRITGTERVREETACSAAECETESSACRSTANATNSRADQSANTSPVRCLDTESRDTEYECPCDRADTCTTHGSDNRCRNTQR